MQEDKSKLEFALLKVPHLLLSALLMFSRACLLNTAAPVSVGVRKCFSHTSVLKCSDRRCRNYQDGRGIPFHGPAHGLSCLVHHKLYSVAYLWLCLIAKTDLCRVYIY